MSKTPLSTYQKKLFVFLSVATFFEGYDFIALTQVLPEVRAAMNLSKAQGGFLVAFIYTGTILAFALVRLADRWGRRRVLTLTIVGYTLTTFATGLSPDPISFAVFQFLARIFLIAEWATTMVIAAEEYPADRRGMVLGVIQGFSAFGSIVCAGVAPLLMEHTAYGWRSVYFVGIVPLVILAVARRSLRESRRFVEQVADGAVKQLSLFHIWRTPYRRRLIQLSLIWALTYLCTQNAVTFWKEFVLESRGFTASQVGLSISIAAVASMPLLFYSGKLLDQIGRKPGAVVIFSMGVLGVIGSYGLHGRWPLTIALVFGIFGASGVLPVLNAFTTELFPTDLRASAFAWSNNLLGRIGYVLGPAIVGVVATDFGWGPAVQITAIGPVIAVILILMWLPETGSKELEETAAV
ncbi:MAG: MFS transporter [Deltaproteobacteria bacterium]|nr:MAG: MFS transporter [Deltaproteobacteria bacterium]